jgi:hypothetical protein
MAAASLFGQSLCMGDPRPRSACAGWQSLQQVRSLIPERIWKQEFDVLVDREAFQKAMPAWTKHERQDGAHQCRTALADSKRYILRSVFTGEYARIDDWYSEFEFSPFWRNPPRICELRGLEKQILKGER